ncbi:MAG TPA: alpha/beta fold hydrolase [Candidatus Limnocylindrales bacterium]|nr:alpha/beta fold hydrolase [Candidatus Limnocylindrales bacterium]
MRLALAAGRIAALLICVAVATGVHADGEQLLRDETSGLQYLEVLTGGAATADPVPIVVAMHGLGDHPETFRLLLDDLPAKARVIFPRGPMPHGDDGFSWFDFQPDDDEGQAALGDGIKAAAERITQLVESLKKQRGGPGRVVVCGFSQGGILSFEMAALHPDLIAEAIPVSGYLPSPLWPAERPKTRPLPKIIALHGEADRLIPLQWANWTVEALRSNGYDISLRSWPKVSHALSPEMRATLISAVVSAVEALSPHDASVGPPEKDAPAPPPEVPASPAR